jgi:hypothetical protein
MSMNWVKRIFVKAKPSIKDEALFPFVEFQNAAEDLIEWSMAMKSPIYRIEWITPDVYSPRTSVWIFSDTDAGLSTWGAETRSTIEKECIRLLGRRKFPSNLVGSVGFVYDSHENVMKHYEGSYFYRLRG